MKHLKILFTTIALLLSYVSANAEIVKIGDLWYDIVKKINKVEVIQKQDPEFDELRGIYLYYDGSIIIPDSIEYDGKFMKVTSIGDGAFAHCPNLNNVVVPKTVKKIGDFAFQQHDEMFSMSIGFGPGKIVLNEGLESIGTGAFYNCYIEELTIPNTVTSIGDNAFSCSWLGSMEIPNSVKNTTAFGWFAGCKFLTSVKLPENIVYIDQLFTDCKYLSSVELPNSITQIGSSTFSGCSNLKELQLPDNLQIIGDNAFDGCSNLTELILPEKIETIGNYAFKDCIQLNKLQFHSNLLKIGNGAYTNCYSLDSVFIPKNVESIGISPFSGCIGISSMIVESTSHYYDSRENCNAIIETSTSSLIAGCKNTIIPNSISVIGLGAFAGCQGLTSILIPNGVAVIEDLAFNKCVHLTNITIPSGVNKIGNNAFANCDELQNVYCYSRILPQIAESAFRESYIEYATLYVPFGSKYIYENGNVWKDFGKIVEINENITFIDSKVEELCVSNWDSDGDGGVSVSEAAVVTDLGDVFKGNNEIVSFGELQHFKGLKTIGDNAFHNCSSLTRVAIANTVTSIGEQAFGNSDNLTTVIVGWTSKIPNISSDVFTNRQNATLYVPKGTKSLYEAAQYWNEFKEIIEGKDVVVAGDTVPSVAYLCGATETTEAIYTALVNGGYEVTPLNYDDVTLTEEIVASDFAGKYDVVVLAGNTGSGTNLAKSANMLLGKVNVLSTKSFWYKHYGTNGTNPGTTDAPSRSIVMTEAEHPIFSGITATEAGEFEVFNDMAKETGRYLQGNGSFADEAYAQTTLGTTNGTDCIGEAWAGDYGYVIIPVDGVHPEGYLTEDGKKLFVNAVQYLIDGVKFTTGIDGINNNVNVLNGDVYSINGIKVRKAGESLKGLAKGLYIVSGKKFIVK